ncbi:MAG: HTH-type transcriptional regulator LutR [Spirochaetes bacterium ADurb.Bin315]|jgi:DNA-binding FadR family transcriptional regulator|nr:GntR family transcriptional regulator [Spirochaetota bacterium]OQA43027.1 MAG: HTH-type transcriptional regulator LutR [Spirochaetes bacterium ADurb.Bin315]HOE89761.1 GntR family transcriptional regulator [Sphaerochaeta sp.]HOR80512.1 GntR family transcriptional regulator [Sphaerochaeta sp.]HPK64293.1 GntR family transcriptional regulator [Sphaerochaeta sp.]
MSDLPQTKSTVIAQTIERWIKDGTLECGSYLPSQVELAEQFRTSSRPIREALKILEARGLVVLSQGRRAQIRSNNLDHYVMSVSSSILNSDISHSKLLKNLMQVRLTVASSAARNFSRLEGRKRYLTQLWAASRQMEVSLPGIYDREAQATQSFLDAEMDFHHTLVMANNNQILSAIYENLSPLLDQAMRSIRFSAGQLDKRAKNYAYLCEALENGQTDLAVALVMVILSTLEDKVLDSYPEEQRRASYA